MSRVGQVLGRTRSIHWSPLFRGGDSGAPLGDLAALWTSQAGTLPAAPMPSPSSRDAPGFIVVSLGCRTFLGEDTEYKSEIGRKAAPVVALRVLTSSEYTA